MTFATLRNYTKWCIALIFVLTVTSSVFGQFYIVGGASYWPSIEPPQSTLYGLPFGDQGDKGVDRNTDLWVGAGYRVNDSWSFEAFFSRLPSTEVDVDLFSIYGGPQIVPQSVSISIATDTTVLGLGAVYEFYINDQVSLIGKVGVARTQQNTEVDVSFPRLPFLPIFFGDDNYFDDDDYYEQYFDDDIYDEILEDDESTFDMYFALGVKLPIQNTPASVSATYQLISTPEDSESGLFVGIHWDL